MEKQTIKVDYSGSGVKTLSVFGLLFFIVAPAAMLVSLFCFMFYLSDAGSHSETEYAISLASSSLYISVGSLAGGIICNVLSTIAKTALYKRALLEERYFFEQYKKEKIDYGDLSEE